MFQGAKMRLGIHVVRRAFCLIAGLCSLLVTAAVCFGQPRSESESSKTLEAASSVKAGRAFVADILAQQPDRDSTNSGVLSIHPKAQPAQSIPVQVKVLVTPTNWLNIYETRLSSGASASKLTVVHTAGQPNQYFLASGGGTNMAAKRLEGNETMIPFASSDFWVCDLGLDFFHWPEQRVLRYETRRSQQCAVLESTNPNPAPGAYARVLCWLQVDSPHGIVQAEARDSSYTLIKQFEPKTLEKVHGQYEPEKLQIRNRQTGSLTLIVYDLDKNGP
jgi:Outer membrane lipoprotein-sorting protein